MRISTNGTLPYIDLPVGSHYYTADLTCAVKEYFGFSVDVAYMVAYNSKPDTVANPIIKAEIAARNPNEPLGMPVYVTNAGEFPAGGAGA